MSESIATAREYEARYGGVGHGWHVVRCVELDGYPQTFRVDGPFTSRAEAERRVALLTFDAAGYIELDDEHRCPHGVHKGLGCRTCDPAAS